VDPYCKDPFIFFGPNHLYPISKDEEILLKLNFKSHLSIFPIFVVFVLLNNEFGLLIF